MRLLIVAADPMEFSRWDSLEPVRAKALPPNLDWVRAARLNGHEVLLAANGAGAARAAAAVDAALAVFPADAVLSTGFCGALEPQLAVADVVVATCVAGPDRRRYPALPVSSAAPFHTGPIRSLDHVAQTAEEKRRLHAAGAAAVEMEAAGVAAHAHSRGLPFYCVRTVTDLAGETMANDFNSALRPDGHFDTMIILRNILRHPLARLPELARLRNRCIRASRALGDFLGDCRF